MQLDQNVTIISCLNCRSSVCIDRLNQVEMDCEICNKLMTLLKCRNSHCDFEMLFCRKCLTFKPLQQKLNAQLKGNDKKTCGFWFGSSAVIVGILGILLFLVYQKFFSKEGLPKMKHEERLRQQFPSQKNETWYHILSVLEQEVPTVKSITLLHGNERKTSDCLAKELVNIFDVNVKMEQVMFEFDRIKFKDYGEVLQHYHTVVKRFRVLVTNLNLVPSDIARAFHSLCDEVSSDIKPSLFIFTLRLDKMTENLKPLTKATTILKEAWNDLPGSDLFPLLSRVLKNVVDVAPEKRAIC